MNAIFRIVPTDADFPTKESDVVSTIPVQYSSESDLAQQYQNCRVQWQDYLVQIETDTYFKMNATTYYEESLDPTHINPATYGINYINKHNLSL